MTITRVTQRMMTNRSVGGMQAGLARISQVQEQLSSGRVLNRPSDSPTGTSAAMRLRDSLSSVKQYQRNGQDGLGWLGQIDGALASVTTSLGRAKDLAIQGANAVNSSPSAREALATEIDQIRSGLVSDANTTYLDRPVFGGVTAGGKAYDSAGAFVGVAGAVNRSVADGVKIRVDVDGPSAFGPPGGSVFDHLSTLSNALRAGDGAGLSASISDLQADLTRIQSARAQAGGAYNRVEAAIGSAADSELRLTASLSDVENVDLPKATIELQLANVAYQAALGATSKVIQPSLLDFLR